MWSSSSCRVGRPATCRRERTRRRAAEVWLCRRRSKTARSRRRRYRPVSSVADTSAVAAGRRHGPKIASVEPPEPKARPRSDHDRLAASGLLNRLVFGRHQMVTERRPHRSDEPAHSRRAGSSAFRANPGGGARRSGSHQPSLRSAVGGRFARRARPLLRRIRAGSFAGWAEWPMAAPAPNRSTVVGHSKPNLSDGRFIRPLRLTLGRAVARRTSESYVGFTSTCVPSPSSPCTSPVR